MHSCFLMSRPWFDQVRLSFMSWTDRHTLWRCLQSTVTPILAGMLEVLDRYANLDLLSDGGVSEGLVKLWMPLSVSLGFIFSHASALSSYTFNFHHLFSTTNTVSLSLSPTHTHTLSHKGFIHNLSIYIVFLSPRCLAHSRRCLHPLVSPKVSENNSKWQISIRLLAHTHNTHTQAAARPLA